MQNAGIYGTATIALIALIAAPRLQAKPRASSTSAPSSLARGEIVAISPLPGHIAQGWPQILPGSVTGTPVAADLDGDGKLEVVAPVMHRGGKALHPQPDIAAQIFAFRADGIPAPGYPVVLVTAAQRLERRPKGSTSLGANWFSSPSVADLDGDGADEIVIPIPGEYPFPRQVRILYLDGADWPWTLSDSPADPWDCVPLVDINNDKEMDIICGSVLTTVKNRPIPGWPPERKLQGGYAPCIGDADGDGDLEVYHPFYEKDWHLPGAPKNGTLGGFDHQGHKLPGWPQKVGNLALYPVMGDVTGDEKMEVCAADAHRNIHLWTWDGQPLPATQPRGEYTSVFKSGIGSWTGSVTLADLDGDNKAEI
ncbi:MAG: VCBS repeat-containing protein, partial [Armatimonadota bacterium]|nr:VCBS repeat-containing protein [Armatimonadota bacterium]